MRESGLKNLLYKALDRVGSDPIQRPTFLAFRSRSHWIRINPTPLMRSGDPDPPTSMGLGRVAWAFGFFSVSWDFLLCTPLFLLFGPPVHCFSYKKSQKITMCSWYVCDCFCDIFTCWRLIKLIGVNFSFDWYILRFFCEFSCMIFSSNSCHMILMLGIWSHDDLPLISW